MSAAEEPLLTTTASVRILQYNILADSYAYLNLSEAVRPEMLAWDNRASLLLNEILCYDADLVCLQEVDHFHDFFHPELASKGGYDGVFMKRPTLRKRDGCAVFFRSKRFVVLDSVEIDFNEMMSSHCPLSSSASPSSSASGFGGGDDELQFEMTEMNDGSSSDDSEERSRSVSDSDYFTNNISLGVFLCEKTKNPEDPAGNGFWIFNTHLFWDPARPDVKMLQTKFLLQEIEKAVYRRRGGVIVCGDFNSTPDSAVYRLISASTDEGTCDLDICDQSVVLRSAYNHYRGEEPPFTNYTATFKGCLDYMWFSVDSFEPVHVSELPTEEELGSCLPNEKHGSDHLPLYCEFEWTRARDCRDGVNCRRVKCRYSHPFLCRFGMQCLKVNAGCRFSHVIPCKYGVSCNDSHCQFNHLACKFGRFCGNKSCVYSHLVMCRFAEDCMRSDCKYSHPKSRSLPCSPRDSHPITAFIKKRPRKAAYHASGCSESLNVPSGPPCGL
eukprot:TRINITY_DN79368_c0_g1_i1.p1 TRINITY_DN79368_c0_g1~~TRINITY_DN79368_c0_g1_i1.p1  ORF type:complete len:498 (-),score=65.16 TRINITY_DN79368_c0_g1_i1:88-1581(-)